MKSLLLVFIGGGLGSVARYLTGKIYPTSWAGFPFGTLTANFLSCLVFGFVLSLAAEKATINQSLKLLLITGFCGGFSTFSSFTFETVQLFKAANITLAFCNIVLNFSLSTLGLFLGMMTYKLL